MDAESCRGQVESPPSRATFHRSKSMKISLLIPKNIFVNSAD
jgi:hypothetical protein